MKSAVRRDRDPVAPKLQHHWDARAAANFIAGGSGGGLLAAAAVVSFGVSDVRALVLAGMVLIAAGLACVALEIGRPWRSLNVFRHLRSSWMSREAALAPLVFACGAAALFTGDELFIVLTGLLGAAFAYSQARMLAADKGIPAWRHPRCVPLVAATALAEGTGFLAGVSPMLPQRIFAGVAIALMLLVAIRAVAWRRYLSGLRKDGAPRDSVRALEAIDVQFLVLGHVLPAALLAAAAAGLPGAAGFLTAAGLLCAGSGWMLKYTLVRRAAFTQGFALKHLPVRGCGAAGTAVRPGWGAG